MLNLLSLFTTPVSTAPHTSKSIQCWKRCTEFSEEINSKEHADAFIC